MGRIDVVINDDLEKNFRMTIVEKFGGKKGTMTVAMEEALQMWVDANKKQD